MGCAQSRKGGCCGLNSSSSSSSDIKLKMRMRGRFLSSDSQNCKILYDNAIAYHQYVSRFDPYKDRTRKLLVRFYISFSFLLFLSHPSTSSPVCSSLSHTITNIQNENHHRQATLHNVGLEDPTKTSDEMSHEDTRVDVWLMQDEEIYRKPIASKIIPGATNIRFLPYAGAPVLAICVNKKLPKRCEYRVQLWEIEDFEERLFEGFRYVIVRVERADEIKGRCTRKSYPSDGMCS